MSTCAANNLRDRETERQRDRETERKSVSPSLCLSVSLSLRLFRMFSNRFKWSLEPNRFAQLVEEKKRAGARILDLTESNPTRAGFDYPAEEILGALAQAPAMLYEPAPRGLPVAREAVAGYYAERGFDVDPERIHLTASTSEAYSFLFKLLAGQGGSVLARQPSYRLFDFLAGLAGVELRPDALPSVHTSGWSIDFDS